MYDARGSHPSTSACVLVLAVLWSHPMLIPRTKRYARQNTPLARQNTPLVRACDDSSAHATIDPRIPRAAPRRRRRGRRPYIYVILARARETAARVSGCDACVRMRRAS
eukprot:5482582-Pleurochrysis_carterae.AAC.1